MTATRLLVLCLASGLLLSCRMAVIPPPPGPPSLPPVAIGDHTYAEVLRERERVAAIKDPAKRAAEGARLDREREHLERELPKFDFSLLGIGGLAGW